MNTVYSKEIFSYDFKEIKTFLEDSFIRMDVFAKLQNEKKIVIKPNLLSVPNSGMNYITTNPIVADAVIEILLNHGVKKEALFIADGASAIHRNMDGVFEKSGFGALAAKYGITCTNLNPTDYFMKNGIKISDFIKDEPFIINIAKLKTHMLTKMTLSVKNLYGLLPSPIKLSYHSQYPDEESFCEMLARVYNAVNPQINIIDGIVGMEGNGPGGGDPVDTAILALSENGFALDHFIIELAGFKLNEILFLKSAIKKGYYNGIYEQKGSSHKLHMKRPSRNNFTFPIGVAGKRISKHLTSSYPKIKNDTCRKCMKCFKMCPEKAIILKNGFPFVRKRKCVTCYCCIEVCPYKSIDTETTFLEKVLSGIKK